MTKYFRILDEVHIPNRWYLGNITANGTDQKVALDIGRMLQAPIVDIEISRDGRPLDYTVTSFGVPVAIYGLSMEMDVIAGSDFQCIPARISGSDGHTVLNCMRRIKCFDESKSEFDRWLPTDHRPDLAGQYKTVTRLIVDRNQIPEDAHMFRIWGWEVALIVSTL